MRQLGLLRFGKNKREEQEAEKRESELIKRRLRAIKSNAGTKPKGKVAEVVQKLAQGDG